MPPIAAPISVPMSDGKPGTISANAFAKSGSTLSSYGRATAPVRHDNVTDRCACGRPDGLPGEAPAGGLAGDVTIGLGGFPSPCRARFGADGLPVCARAQLRISERG